MTGAGDTEESLLFLARALVTIDAGLKTEDKQPLSTLPPALTELSLLPEAALQSSFATVPIREAVGRVSAGYLWAYPPGIPLLIPGERITEETVAFLENTGERITLRGTRPGAPSRIAVVL